MMIESANPQAAANYSVIPAIVTRNDDDTDKLGRVKVRFPWMDGKQESDWIHVASPGAGKDRGLCFVPEVGDLVLIAFAYGQVDRGYVIGSLWSKADKPPADRQKRTLRSVSGHTITLDDTKDAESISIVDKTGNNKIVIDAKNNTITIESGGDLIIHAKGKLGLESDGDLAIKGKTVAIEGTSDAAVKAPTIAIDGSSGVTINSVLEVV
ncbi:MAG TPA: phage baseplate assembly protein V [Kofleriaceae bacterium]